MDPPTLDIDLYHEGELNKALRAEQEGGGVSFTHLIVSFDKYWRRLQVTAPRELSDPGRSVSNSIQASDLAKLLRGNKNEAGVEVMELHHLDIQGDLRPLMLAVSQQKQMTTFKSFSCQFDTNQFIDVLFELPCLQNLGPWTDQFIPASKLSGLIQQGILRNLIVHPASPFFTEVLEADNFFHSVQNSLRLTTLDCSSVSFTDDYIDLVARMLQRNSTLQNLTLGVGGNAKIRNIADSLRINVSLKHLYVRLDLEPLKPDIMCFLDVLINENKSLEALRVNKRGRSSVPTGLQKLQELVDFYLLLNRSGRNRLLRGNMNSTGTITSQEWLDGIGNQEHLSVVFYFAQHNPFLILPLSLGGAVPRLPC